MSKKTKSITDKDGNAYIYNAKTKKVKASMDKYGNLYDDKGKFLHHIDGGDTKRLF